MSNTEEDSIQDEQQLDDEKDSPVDAKPVVIDFDDSTPVPDTKEKKEGSKTGPKNRFFPSDDIYLASHAMMNFEFKTAREILDQTRNFCPVS